MSRFPLDAVRPWVAAVLAVAATATAGKADELDKVLAGNARAVMGTLTAAKYANVGVLKFEVQLGGPAGPVRPNLGQMNESMATRLENALILAAKGAEPVGITRGASRAAVAADPAATARTESGRADLFKHKYPLAWGDKSVPVDAFLLGRVTFAPDLRTAVVSLRLFDAKTPAELKDVPLTEATVPVGRQMLTDIDQAFVVRARGGKTPELVESSLDTSTEAVKGSGWASVDDLLDLRVYYDGKPVARQPDGNLPPPEPGQKVHFTVRDRGNDRLGVALLVNGINTIDKETGRGADRYTKWVLEPNKDYKVRGFYKNDKVEEFRAVPPAEGQQLLSELASPARIGELEVLVYREVKSGSALTLDRYRTTFREYDGTAPTLKTAQQKIALAQMASGEPVRRSLIVGGTASGQKLESSEFEGVLVARVVLRYTPAGK